MDFSSLNYDQIKEIAGTCTKCELSKTRQKVVFGDGPVPCDLMLIGEGPGADEDEQGLPFVGRAGQLLSKILESVQIDRKKDIYIANIVKCRPPNNRAPLPEETSACYPYLEAQINLIKPKIIILAGAPATKVVLKNETPISQIRGKWFTLEKSGKGQVTEEEIAVIPIFHPSYLLRNPSKEKGSPKWLTWQDMIEIKNALECVRKVKELNS